MLQPGLIRKLNRSGSELTALGNANRSIEIEKNATLNQANADAQKGLENRRAALYDEFEKAKKAKNPTDRQRELLNKAKEGTFNDSYRSHRDAKE